MRPHGLRQPRLWTALAWTLFFVLLGAPVYAQPPTGTESNVEYIDSAIPSNQFRLRFDAAYGNNRPDRAELFYSQYSKQPFTDPPGPGGGNQGKGGATQGGGGTVQFNNSGKGKNTFVVGNNAFVYNPQANGLPSVETNIDYQDVSAYLEVAINNHLSGFVEVPTRFLNPDVNGNTAGLADMNAGFKWAFLYSDEYALTFQLRTYLPTGAASRGLGNDHVSLEPALLYYQRLTDRVGLHAELRDTIPVGGTDFEGNVMRYGVGLSYLAYERNCLRIVPAIELVGWTVLSGQETLSNPANLAFDIRDSAGDTIINAKVGVRVGIGEANDFAISYGRALTGDVWYKDIFRLEYSYRF